MCSGAANVAWRVDKGEKVNRHQHSFTCKTCCSSSPLFSVHLLCHRLPYSMVSMETEVVVQKKKKTVPAREFFSSVPPHPPRFFSFSLSLPNSLPPSLAESQAACGAINIINQHNSTALSSAGRDEEARGNVNMPAWSSLNQ